MTSTMPDPDPGETKSPDDIVLPPEPGSVTDPDHGEPGVAEPLPADDADTDNDWPDDE